jgi:hypothetical protein
MRTNRPDVDGHYHDRIKEDVEVRAVMPYLMDIEKIAIEKGRKEGREEGRREGLIQALTLELQLRFGEKGMKLLPEVQKITSSALLGDLVESLRRASSLKDFERQLRRSVDSKRPRP